MPLPPIEMQAPLSDKLSEREAQQVSDYFDILDFTSTNDSLTVEQRKTMARYIATYGNLLPPVLQTNEKKEAFTTEEVAKAYYVSDAFAARAKRSLGYGSNEEMPSKDKAIYDRMIQRGIDAGQIDVVFERDMDINDSYFIDIDDMNLAPDEEMPLWIYGEHAAHIGTNVPEDLKNPENTKDPYGMDTLGHEMGHVLYNSANDDRWLSPGVNRTVKDGDSEQSYGRPGSPLNTINASKSQYGKLLSHGKYMDDHYYPERKEFHEQDGYRSFVKSSREHDDKGSERGADVHGVRMLMMQDGIWNFFSGKKVTLEQVLQFKKEHPTSRVFQYWTPQQVAYYLNYIAKADAIPQQEYNNADAKIDVASLSSSIFDKLMEEQATSLSQRQGRA